MSTAINEKNNLNQTNNSDSNNNFKMEIEDYNFKLNESNVDFNN